jgi:hypothetical protein
LVLVVIVIALVSVRQNYFPHRMGRGPPQFL